jgi:hypothetical protein
LDVKLKKLFVKKFINKDDDDDDDDDDVGW